MKAPPRVAPLGVAQATAQRKAEAVGHLHLRRAEHAGVSSLAGKIRRLLRHPPRGPLEQGIGAADLVAGIGTMQHEPFTALRDYLRRATGDWRLAAEVY